jgi:hypothetical protein
MDYEADKDGFVELGELRKILDQQTQYIARYTEIESIRQNLRFKNLDQDYHDFKIHKDDIDEFIDRIRTYRESQ